MYYLDLHTQNQPDNLAQSKILLSYWCNLYQYSNAQELVESDPQVQVVLYNVADIERQHPEPAELVTEVEA